MMSWLFSDTKLLPENGNKFFNNAFHLSTYLFYSTKLLNI